MPRPSNTEERKAQITRALMKVMAKRGYDGASVAEIAKVARLTPGLVHYHFKNKQQILLAALAWLTERHEALLDAKLAAAGDPIGQVEAFIDLHLGLGAEANPEVLACWVQLSGEALRERKVGVEFERALGGLVQRLTVVIEDGAAKWLFSCESAPAAASALVATLQGYFVLAATARSLIPKGSAAATTKRMANGLLQPARRMA